jgi:hypothetical protein
MELNEGVNCPEELQESSYGCDLFIELSEALGFAAPPLKHPHDSFNYPLLISPVPLDLRI